MGVVKDHSWMTPFIQRGLFCERLYTENLGIEKDNDFSMVWLTIN